MIQKTFTGRALSSALLLSSLAAGSAAFAQDEGGVRLSFTIEQRLETGRNIRLTTPEEGNGTLATTRLSFSAVTETRTQSFALDGMAQLRLANLPGSGTDTDLDDHNLRFTYTRESAGSALRLTAGLDRENLAFPAPLSRFISETGDIALPEDFDDRDGGGIRRSRDIAASLEMGRESTIGSYLEAGASATRYSGTTDPDLTGSDTVFARAGLIFRVAPTTTARFDLGYERTDEDDPDLTETTIRTAALGLEHELSSRLRMTARLGYRIEDTDETPGGLPPTLSARVRGSTGSLGFTYDMPNGTLGADIDSVIDGAGRSTTLRISRAMDLPNNGSLAASLGVTDPEGADAELIGSLAYRQEFGPADLIVNASRRVATNDDDETSPVDTLALGYVRHISQASRIALAAAFVRTGETPSAAASEHLDISATYERDLAPSWALNTGLVYRKRSEGALSADSPSIFIAISKSFNARY